MSTMFGVLNGRVHLQNILNSPTLRFKLFEFASDNGQHSKCPVHFCSALSWLLWSRCALHSTLLRCLFLIRGNCVNIN